jgi:hypothetical protein
VAVNCQTTALTGSDGLITFKPAGVQFCLSDATDFPTGRYITVPGNHDYRVDDPVVFKADGAGALDTALTANTKYFVVDTNKTGIAVSATKGGVPISLTNTGGQAGSGIASLAAGTAGVGYTPGTYTDVRLVQTIGTGAGATSESSARATVVVPAGGALNAGAISITSKGEGYTTATGTISLSGGRNASGDAIDKVAPGTAFGGTATLTTARENSTGHINIGYAEDSVVCQVQEWSMDFSREEIDITTLPCKTGGEADKYASFRTTIPGFASGSGTMSILFSGDSTSLSSRLISNSLLKSQAGASVKLYVNAIEGAGGIMDDTASSYIEAPVSLAGFSISVNTSDAIVASINFNLSGPPSHLFNLSLA